jgi:hypothetical protein
MPAAVVSGQERPFSGFGQHAPVDDVFHGGKLP